MSTRLALSRLLDDAEVPAEIGQTARVLALSVRTLQRRLRAEGTSFEREVWNSRVRRAQRLMLETDLPLSRVAQDAGFVSLSRLSVVFRRIIGTTPSAWRRERRESVVAEQEPENTASLLSVGVRMLAEPQVLLATA
ncbi:Transcriptional regulator, AraC family [Labilithrix luteola]|uniref:Transcriptional regulator, AraC family n=1 Tax=Labilithrix luteola TaxID=1391654 RepID=A0A0K1PNW5_9BACT|nr:helix-turn-helix transcriptional regulator [Labilithrix luteola]AKU94809.1 Transcriptional regulator, AraC family [Labilithrix luteola]